MDLESFQLSLAQERVEELRRIGDIATMLGGMLKRIHRDTLAVAEVVRVFHADPEPVATILWAIHSAGVDFPPPRTSLAVRMFDSASDMLGRLVMAVVHRMREAHGPGADAAIRIFAEYLSASSFSDPVTYDDVLLYDPQLVVDFVQHCRDGLVHLMSKA